MFIEASRVKFENTLQEAAASSSNIKIAKETPAN